MRRTLSPLETHCRALADCRLCGHAAHIRPILSEATNPHVMIVGQAPGKVEMEGGKPFAGRAGRTLFRWLERAGISEEDARRSIYIAAITRCFPGASPSGRGDRVPSPAEQETCAVWLDSELRIIRPKLLIPIGKLAITRFLPNRPLDELIGRRHVVEHAGGRCDAVPLPHPSGASSWVHQGDHPQLLDRALRLIAKDLREFGVTKPARRRSVA